MPVIPLINLYNALSRKPFSNFRCDLVVCHIVHGFNLNDALLKPIFLQMFRKFMLGITGSKDLDQLCVTNMSDDLVKIFTKLRVKFFVSNSLCCLQTILS